MAVAFNRFQILSEDLAEKVHNFDTDTLRVYLSNDAPTAASDAVKTDVTEISTGSGYSGAVDTQNSTSRSGAVTSVVGVSFTVTASGGPIGPFRYVVLYNDTPTSPADPLIGWWDYTSAITLADGEAILIQFGSSMFTVG